MISDYILYVASGSPSRHQLLKDAQIPFKVIKQTADESLISRDQSLEDAVMQTAQLKMEHVIMPAGKEGEIAFVLTADTMGVNSAGIVQGKPLNYEEAAQMIRSYRQGATTGTGVCIERRIYEGGHWITQQSKRLYVAASYVFDMPDQWIDYYIQNCRQLHGIDVLEVSGGVAIEDFGAQFVHDLVGSYTTVIGLPMYEVRRALVELGFYSI